MAGQQNSKLKLLYLRDILEKYTDENHVLNAAEIAEILEEQHGIVCERKSLYTDIDILGRYGVDIIKTRTPRVGFFVGERRFERAEIRLLCDAVQAANFISKTKTIKLTDKIESYLSVYQADDLRRQVYVDSRAKCGNERIYYIIETLDAAIKKQKKVKLLYIRRNIGERFSTEKSIREFILSPYSLIWSQDHYYLVANNEKYDNLMNLRIDRMSVVEILDDPARDLSEVSPYENSFDPADYTKKAFNMFSGSAETVELECKNERLEQIFDKFGENSNIRKIDGDRFLLHADVFINEGLVSWIVQYGDTIKVKAPEELKNMVMDRVNAIIGLYQTEN